MEGETSQKRSRETATDSSEEPPAKRPPAYGEQDYWEQRYDKNLMKEASGEQDDNPEAFHSWYFSYDELSPILLPIILGDSVDDLGDTDDDELNEENEQEDSPNNQISASAGQEDEEDNSDDGGGESVNEGCNGLGPGEDESDDFIEIEEIEDDESGDQAPTRAGLSKDGAIAVLEVGCGDVPLGRDLVRGIEKLESATGSAASNILKNVVCVDYAKSVVDALKAEQQKESQKSVSVLYEVGDARKLVYSDASFDLILEKGTMDAMLSDKSEGVENCKLIVAECARLLTVGGCLLIVSHLNAHVQSGLEWLDMIVLPGLRKGATHNSWEIEVHGNAPATPPANDEGDEDEQPSPGPAVYVICKGKTISNDGTSVEPLPEKGLLPTIPLRFFSY